MSKVADLYRFLRSQQRDLKLRMLIYFVTSHCNAKCRTCFYWQELNQRGDLTFDQISKVSSTAPKFTDLWLSGGEPSLRPELAEIIDMFVRNNSIKRINFPTNGLLPDRISKVLNSALEHNPELDIYCNLSVDGLKETHDSIRGVPGNFDKMLECARVLGVLKRKFGARLRLNVNTVVCKENYEQVADLAEFLKKNVEIDGQYFQVVRGETMDQNLKFIPVESLKRVYRTAVENYEHYSERVIEEKQPLSRWFKKAIYIGALTFHNKVQFSSYQNKRPWPMKCSAGMTSAVLDYNGYVRACELREPIAHLRDYDYNFGAFWADQVRSKELKAIEEANCSTWCTHVCFLHDSMLNSKRALFYEIPKSYITRKKW
jgi:Fe-coproporphyrin III synthase